MTCQRVTVTKNKVSNQDTYIIIHRIKATRNHQIQNMHQLTANHAIKICMAIC